ncbi:amidohydrolase [Mesorhizobium sp. M2A.F.Ca.ET.037.01.1.1]|uniref:amidohydrolase family protein n=3 Tax=Mesorhizobium TaxID=68287 RepID=UPI000F74C55E|nr:MULTISPECIES: amidohydrolase [unclassified Mesorhizobium]RUY00958.1 amidohydrolase [Mesorhizobium sp. M2A.F.Ca.ET.040.01.1.1]AZO33897.1 amidohydrolase [Mesorhizobium sp. M2A.F.Ca.ET.046.03.2.1]RUX16539.1 amidohydrolase [Mesorhizobium sp. M2A.F.Ca.ET.037.01.1.1]RWA91448.1 MAG: amidohydrolase [Mesorhizobium sp.]RWB47148.1 MAG: amidohydrolase [Mesorhizobium sp.]
MSESMILAGDHLLTMDATNSVIADGAVLIEDGRIAAVGKLREISADNPSTPVKKIADSVLMPGIVNAHAHSGFLRGTAEHLPVWDWLTLHINPMHRVLQPHEAEAASWLCYAESVLGGTTAVVDMWRFMEGSAKAAEAIGNRLVAVPYVGEHPDYNYFDTLDMNEAMIETWHGKAGGRVNVWVGLEHLFYADEAGQRRAVELAKKHGTGFHTHCSEARIELAEFERRYGKRPMYVLDDLGFFETPLAMIAHGVWLDSAEIEFIAKRRVSVAHNPVSNMKLASGIALVGEMLAAGVAVGIGTDGEKENNNFDMFEEMKVASLLGKLKDLDAAAMDSWQVLRMATITGAKAIGLDAEIGSIEPGKRADIIAVRADTPRMTPLYGEGPYFNLQHNLVHAVRGSDVAMTMIDGQIVVEDGELKTADLGEIIAEVRKVAPGLFARRAAFLAENAGGIRQWTD